MRNTREGKSALLEVFRRLPDRHSEQTVSFCDDRDIFIHFGG